MPRLKAPAPRGSSSIRSTRSCCDERLSTGDGRRSKPGVADWRRPTSPGRARRSRASSMTSGAGAMWRCGDGRNASTAFDGAFESRAASCSGLERRRRADVRAAIRRRGAARPQGRRAAAAEAVHGRGLRGRPVEQRVQPLEHVGCYVPGGRYPAASTLLMTVVPARVAGVAE